LLNPWIRAQENWTPAQKEDLTGWEVGIKINRGAVDMPSLEKSEFLISPETENSHWLKGDKNVITLTMADHDCLQVHFAACSSCLH